MDLSSRGTVRTLRATELNSGDAGEERRTRPDVFLSYARDDVETAERLVAELEKQGWSVWWDREIPPGKDYQDYIGARLDESRCVIVLWSNRSVASRWVTAEAETAADRDALVPVLIEAVKPPVGVRQIQAAALTDWKGESSHPELLRLLNGVAAVLEAPPPLPPRTGKKLAVMRWAATTALIAPIPVVLLLGSLPVGQADVIMNLRLSEIGFVLRETAPLLSDPLDLIELGASGLDEIELLGPNGSREPYKADIALLAAAGSDGGTGSIAVELGVINRGVRVWLRHTGTASAYRLSLTGDLPELGATVDGEVRVLIPRWIDRRSEFERDRIALRPGPGELALDLTLATGAGTVFAASLPIEGLQLWRIDRYREGGRSADPAVATLLTGDIQYESGGPSSLRLEKGQLLRFTEAIGAIRNLELGEHDIALRFEGRVRGMSTERGDGVSNLMPSLLNVLWSGNALPLGIALASYALVLGAITYRTWTRPL